MINISKYLKQAKVDENGIDVNPSKTIFKKRNHKIVVKYREEDEEWVAEYYINNKYDEGKTFYSGGRDNSYKKDAQNTAYDMLKRI